MSFDLNLDNYNYEDLTQLFKIKKYKNSPSIQTKCELVQRMCEKNIQEFYLKSSKALYCIHELIQRNELDRNDVSINQELEKIISVPAFEHFDVGTLIEKIKPPVPEVVVQAFTNPIFSITESLNVFFPTTKDGSSQIKYKTLLRFPI